MSGLKTSLSRKGLAVEGTVPEKLARLLKAPQLKCEWRSRKNKPAASSAPTVAQAEPDVYADEFSVFTRKERENLVASGVSDEKIIDQEVERRWNETLRHVSDADDRSTVSSFRQSESNPCHAAVVEKEIRYLCELTTMRIFKKMPTTHIIADLSAFGVPSAGKTKKQLARLLADQLHYITDDEGCA